MKVTIESKAFLSNDSSVTPQQLQTAEGASRLHFFRSDMSEYGYTYVGKAEITVEVPDVRELVENKVTALRAQAVAIRADATAKCTAIEGQIQNLLAIEHTPAAEQTEA